MAIEWVMHRNDNLGGQVSTANTLFFNTYSVFAEGKKVSSPEVIFSDNFIVQRYFFAVDRDVEFLRR